MDIDRLIEAAKIDTGAVTCHLSFDKDGVKIYGRVSGLNGNPINREHKVFWEEIKMEVLNPLPLAMLKMRDAMLEERDA